MTSWKLDSLVVENFRSISGRWSIPLNANVVLVHGPNGAGKTSLLSAIELGATGRVAHLTNKDDDARLVNRNYPLGEVELAMRDGDATRVGRVEFSPTTIRGDGALKGRERIDFLERCFLPQTVLGRLLESYSKQDQTDSALVRFVKDLAGIDDLDSLIAGLYPAGHLARVRTLSPAWRRLEGSIEKSQTDFARAQSELDQSNARVSAAMAALREISPDDASPKLDDEPLVATARDLTRDAESVRAQLADVESRRVRLDGLLLALARIETTDSDELAASLAANAQHQFDLWERGAGAETLRVLNGIRERLGRPVAQQSLLFAAFDETKLLLQLLSSQEREAARALAERERTTELREAQQVALRSQIEQLEASRSDLGVADDVRLLLDSLASTLPLLHTDSCPICDQAYPGGAEALQTHVRDRITGLSTAATQYAEIGSALEASRARLTALAELVAEEPRASGVSNKSADLIRELNGIESELLRGGELRQAMEATQARLAEMATARSTIDAAEDGLRALMTESGVTRGEGAVVDAARSLESELLRQQQDAQFRVTLADRAHTALEQLNAGRREVAANAAIVAEVSARLRTERARLSDAKKRKDAANQLRMEAERVRSTLISEVFDGALNRTWADFFSRLVPNEPFVPQFQQHVQDSRVIDVTLETIDPRGERFGSPSAMLSFGNANTAALSLFLALHVSAPTAIDWLIFDDPVQSMDEIHVANFAAVIRQLTATQERQVVIAVHQRELFDYLSFELAPATASDQLIQIELERRGEVSQVRWERIGHAPEGAIASGLKS